VQVGANRQTADGEVTVKVEGIEGLIASDGLILHMSRRRRASVPQMFNC